MAISTFLLLLMMFHENCGKFLRSKYHVLQHFKKFHATMERNIDKVLKCCWTNNGVEYTPNERDIRH